MVRVSVATKVTYRSWSGSWCGCGIGSAACALEMDRLCALRTFRPLSATLPPWGFTPRLPARLYHSGASARPYAIQAFVVGCRGSSGSRRSNSPPTACEWPKPVGVDERRPTRRPPTMRSFRVEPRRNSVSSRPRGARAGRSPAALPGPARPAWPRRCPGAPVRPDRNRSTR